MQTSDRADHARFAGRDAYLPLAAHAPGSGGGPSPRWTAAPARRPFPWTAWKISGLALVLVAALAGVLVVAASARSERYTMDTTTSRGTANAYFAALQRGDDQTVMQLTCEELLVGRPGPPDTVRRALGRGSPRPPEWELGPGYGGHDGPHAVRYHDFLVPRKVRGAVSVEHDPGKGWRVCQFFEVEVWVESPG